MYVVEWRGAGEGSENGRRKGGSEGGEREGGKEFKVRWRHVSLA